MSKRAKVVFTLLCVLLLGAASLLWLGASTLLRGGSRAAATSQQDLMKEIDEKARAAAGGDEKAVRELADALARTPQLFHVPSLIMYPIKERLIRAEMNYRRGRREGVAEESIVRLLDELAQKLDAPAYARTDADEVRALRLSLSYMMPNFIAQRPAPESAETTHVWLSLRPPTFSVSPAMSPLEAAYVALMLIEQKQINETYLLTRDERAEIISALKKLDAADPRLTDEERTRVALGLVGQKLNAGKTQHTPEELAARAKKITAEQGGETRGAVLVSRVESVREKEMRAVVSRANALGILEGVKLANRSFDLLGIER